MYKINLEFGYKIYERTKEGRLIEPTCRERYSDRDSYPFKYHFFDSIEDAQNAINERLKKDMKDDGHLSSDYRSLVIVNAVEQYYED